MNSSNVTIIGMGLIGTSLGLALKKSGNKDLKITGHDKDHGHTRTAAKMGAIDTAEANLPKSVSNAGLVIIATPVIAIKEVMGQIAPYLPEGCLVTDTGSTKQDILGWADATLPKTVEFVGGHPMAGKESSGPESAVSTLFQGAAYVVIPSARASKAATEAITHIAEVVGAKPFYVNAQEHDAFVAAVSHLPLVTASILALSVIKSPAWHEMARLASSGFRDTTRLASGDPTMSRDICMTNAQEIVPWIDRFITEMMEFRRLLIEGNQAAVANHFEWTAQQRDRWVGGAELGPSQGAKMQIPGAAEQMAALFLGETLARKSQALMDQYNPKDEKKKSS